MTHRYLCIVVGNWKLENWRLYRFRRHESVSRNEDGSPKASFNQWDRWPESEVGR